MTSRHISHNSNRYEQAIDALIESPETDSDLVKSCFWELRNAYALCSKRIARWLIFAIILGCVFELINLKFISKASFSFIEITRLNFLMYILPSAVAFTLIQVFAIAIEQNVYQELLLKLAEKKLPGLHMSSMDRLFLAQAGILGADLPKRLKGLGGNVLDYYNGLQFMLVLVIYAAFELYAYSILLSHSYSRSASYLSLTATIFLSIIMILFLTVVVKEAEPE
jgi:hypothetical protein